MSDQPTRRTRRPAPPATTAEPAKGPGERRATQRRTGERRSAPRRETDIVARGAAAASAGVSFRARTRAAVASYGGHMGRGEQLIYLGGPILLVVLGVLAYALYIVGGPIVDFIANNLFIVRFVAAVTAILLMTVPTAFVIIYLELKVIARMNLRIGPNRIAPFGSAMSVTAGLKVLAKEDFTPTGADVGVFTLAPLITFLATVMTLLVIPFAPALVGQDLNIGLLYFFALGGLTVVGLLMAGWSSFNKYSLLGGLRSAAQIVSYEIPLTLSVVGVIILAGTMSLNHIVAAQSGSLFDWFVFKQPLAALIFFIAATAEANRTPFDMTEADSEIVAGFATEYSGMRFGFFFFAEYVNVFVVSAMIATLFFGGWTAPFNSPINFNLNAFDPFAISPIVYGIVAMNVLFVGTLFFALVIRLFGGREWGSWLFGLFSLDSLILGGAIISGLLVLVLGGLAFIAIDWVRDLSWFMAKVYFFVFVFIWMRATLPRVRIDQLMGFAWKWLLPAALLNLFVTAIAVVLINPGTPR